MKHFIIALISTAVLATGQVHAADAKSKGAADRKALIAEEKDRLAREKKELQEREALLTKQLETSQKLTAEKEAYMKQLQEEIKKLKSGK